MKEQVSPQLTALKTADDSVASPLLVRPVGQDTDSTPTHAESPRQDQLALSQTPPPPPPKSPYRRLSHLVIAPSMMIPAGCMSPPSPSSSPVLPDILGPGTHLSSTNTPRLARSCEKLTPTSNSLQSPIAQRRFSNSSIQSVTMGYGRESMSLSRSPSKLRWIVSEAKIGGSSSSSPSSPQDSLRSHRQSIAANPKGAAIHLAAGLLVWELLDEHAGADQLSLDIRNECRNRLQALSYEFQPGRYLSDMAKSEDTPDEKEQRLFYEAVEDGYVVCQFINKLKPGMIAHISVDETSVARSWNVPKFLAAATTLGVPEKHLFRPSDLLECIPDGLHRFAQTINAVALIAGIKPNRTVVKPPKDISREKQMDVPRDPKNYLYVTPVTRRSTSTPNLRREDHQPGRTSPTRSPKHARDANASQSQPASPLTKAEKFDYLDGLGGQTCLPSTEILSPNNAKMVITILRDDDVSSVHFQLSNYIIGRGRLGCVYRAVNLETGELVAVKRIPLRGMSEDDIQQIMDDVELFRTLSHPHIIKYFGACRDDSFINVVQEFAFRGSLSRTLKTFGKLTERRISSYVITILDALNHLHRRDIVHGDLKSSNVLTTQLGGIKLSFAFGVSRGINRRQRHDVVGTPYFSAPEVIAHQGASPASDIWSLAFTVIELLSGQSPYSEVDSALSVMFRIVEEEIPPIPDECSEGLKDFLHSCLQKDPNKRPDAKHLGDHTWLKDNTVWSGPRSLDTIPFLRRVTNREKPTVTGTVLNISPSTNTTTEEQDTSYSSGAFSELEDRVHLFFVTKFDKPVTCSICKNPFKIINGLQCTRCSATIHSRCEKKSLSNCNQSRSSDALSSTASQSDILPTPLPYRQSVSSTSGTMSSWESLKSLDVRLSRVLARKLKGGKDGKCVVQ